MFKNGRLLRLFLRSKQVSKNVQQRAYSTGGYEKFGNVPRYLHNVRRDNTGLPWIIIFLIFAPSVIIPTVLDHVYMKHIQEGDRKFLFYNLLTNVFSTCTRI